MTCERPRQQCQCTCTSAVPASFILATTRLANVLIKPLARQPAAAVAHVAGVKVFTLLTDTAGPQTTCLTPCMQRHQIAVGSSQHHGENTAARFTMRHRASISLGLSASASMRCNEDVHRGACLSSALGMQATSAHLCVIRPRPQYVDRGTGISCQLWPPPACARTASAPGLVGIAAYMVYALTLSIDRSLFMSR